ncbi:WD repeat- and FYVE domain-containing protein 4 isoform X1 [Astyanax mexicanus]|uniref:WD repeat- and FYVE domain-containing protein 4 isoform X1 n=1 Tax=Astyanax mexicanus TaxID=7994 RepID=UPI0020CAB89B|nr:WD repeat- and FYVE domain-containing protein 4 isoform X1 [Astyanax mexicanus]
MPPTKQQEAGGDMERINKETGELSASGEIAESTELKTDKAQTEPSTQEDTHTDANAVTALQQQLLQLSQAAADQREHELDLLLPLFIQVSESNSADEDLDLKDLACQIGETLVCHIQQRVAGRPAEEARYELKQFFQHTEHSSGKGWLLLKSISILSSSEAGTNAAIDTGLAAALVKCLYLFVALPARKANNETDDSACSFQDIFIKVILQLCRQVQFVEELVETQELQCVIIALTSLWDQCSSSWRRQVSRVLRAVSAAQVPNTVPALQVKNCMKICIQNMLKMSQHVPGPVLAEVAVSVFSFVKDSYPINPALFEEFENNDGYAVLQTIMARCEEETAHEDFSSVKDLLCLIASFTLFGKAELKVALCVNNPQPPGFKFDPALTKGSTVKNLRAFKIIQASFLRSGSALTCSQILRTVQMIWSWDKANFFLLEWTLQCLAQFAECVWQKPATVHRLFFELVEMVVFHLSYIPHDTLKKVQAMLKEGSSQAFSMAALECFHGLVMRSGLLSEVLIDGGLMELLLVELRRRAKILRKAGVTASKDDLRVEDCERQLTTNMLNVVSALAMRSVRNTACIRDLGMIPYIKIFLNDEQFRSPALCILEQLSEMNPEEYMSTAIGALCSSTENELRFKLDVLQSILKVLDNPNSWNAFRTAGGFNGLLSIVVDMEGALLEQPLGVWASVSHSSLMELLLLTLHVVALVVHLHPVNAHFFHTTGHYEKLAEALLQLGCFHDSVHMKADVATECRSGQRNYRQFVDVAESSGSPLPKTLRDCIRLLNFLEQFSTGVSMSVDMCSGLEASEVEESQQTPTIPKTGEEDFQGRIRNAALSISSGCGESGRFSCEHTILHPGAVKVMMILVPHIYFPSDPQMSAELQLAVTGHVQSMVKSEQNRQIMCESGLLVTLLTHCKSILSNSGHLLHLPVVRILEKLASQSIDHKCLRQFLCLGDPLMCNTEKCFPPSISEADPPLPNGQYTDKADDLVKTAKKTHKKSLKRTFSLLWTSPKSRIPIPLHRIISLVSMTSPRSFRPHKVSVSPSFAEFDMTDSGYGCLFLPSLATVKGVSADCISTGGTSSDCRGFPPSAGLSFSCWFLISRFSSACDSHPVRLLTVVRHMSRAEQQYCCLSVSISASDGCLVISTEEEPYQFLDILEPEVRTPTTLPITVRFKCSKQLMPGQWHHLVVAMAKDIKKSCKVSAYLNGEVIGTSKMRYIQPFPGQCIAMDASAVIDVCGIIGTPPIWKQHAALIWRVGPAYLFEEVLSADSVEIMYAQGTKYIGNYLALDVQADSSMRLIPPERISFGINPAVFTVTTVAEIRDQYNEVDCRLIAKEMGITSRDNSTPVFLARNISQHLSGTARTIGAALVGRFAVRTFTSNSAATSFQYVGGPAVVLSLVAMASDDGSLYASIKVLLSILDTNQVMRREMKRINGYKLFAFLLKMKAHLISSRTFQLILAIVGAMELTTGCIYIHDLTALQDILCDFEVWQKAPESLDLSVLNHFVEILKSSSGDPQNAETMHSLDLMAKLLFLLQDPSVTHRKVTVICTIVKYLLQGHFSTADVRRLGLFLIYTLMPPSVDENTAFPGNISDDQSQSLSQTPARTVWIRNQLLEVLSSLIICDSPLPNNNQEEVFLTLGSDWFLLFLQGHTHSSTVLLIIRLLIHFLSNQSILTKFRDGVSPGTLVESMEMPQDVIGHLGLHSWSFECLSCTCPGFTVLPRLLLSHISSPQIYGAFAALLMGKADFHIPNGQVDLDSLLQSVIDSFTNEQVQLCIEAACVLIELVKMIICKPVTGTEGSWEVQYPGSVMQFLCLLHSLFPRDPLWASTDFLNSLASAVFPTEAPESFAGLQGNGEARTVGESPVARLSHPARKQVCDFIRILLMDSLINIPAKDHNHPFIQLLEFSPDGVCQEQKQSFQSELLEFLMDIIHMTGQEDGQSTHVARDDPKPSKSKPEGKVAILIENVAFFSKMLVEKLYTGMFVVDPENLLVFVAEQIAVAMEKAQTQRESTVSVLYKSMNRALLYFLSRPRQTPAEQELVLRTLTVLQQHWDVIMATYNANVHFISCLLHCLLLIRSGSFQEGFGCEMHKKSSKKIWRHLFPHKNNRMMTPVDIPDSAAEMESELMKLVENIWSKVMLERRQSLEEAYKIDLSAKQAGREVPVSMMDVSPLWEETAEKAWQVFIDSQKKKMSNVQKKAGLLSSVHRSPQRRAGVDSDSSVETFLADMEVHRKTGEEMFERLLKSHMQMLHCENERMAAQWVRIEEDLLRERGLFGPGPDVFINQGWVQDAAEGPNRTRPRIRRKALRRSKKLPSLMSALHMKSSVVEESKGVAELPSADSELRTLCEAGREAEEEPGSDCERLTFFPTLTEASAPVEDLHSEQCAETQLILQQLAANEEVKAKQCVAVVSGHMLTEGVLLYGKTDLYICEGFTLTSSGDVCCGTHHPTSVRDSFISEMLKKEQSSVNPACRRWPYADIKEARFMRFLLEENAIEIFMRNGSSVFLVFVNKDHVGAFKRLCSVVPSLKGRGVAEAVHNVRRTAALEKTALIKWQKGEMSNFEYLMHLNTLAGRTYNDLMQYPVFPWVLADYESETLDLSSSTTFRDLSRPMGAQTEKRREKFIERYNEVDSNDGDLSAQCHYCTHYSSAIIVASYLVRMEPFSQTFLSLQGGSFDVPERMFHSVQREWESASRDNMSDVRELIPEFYYLPDFLVNSNNFEFGRMQDGTSLGDVVLPPWAKGDPQEFIRMHREALESDYVSANLHLWIDLIFGYRQQGPAAVEALNTFHPYFYTDRHDAESMKNPLKKSTVLGYVSNFGQIPKQLFTKPHPNRAAHKSSASKEASGANHVTPFFFRLDKLKPSAQPIKELMHGSVGQIVCGEKDVLVVEKNKLLMPPHWNTYFCWGYYDNTCSFGNYTTEKGFAVWEGLSDWGETVCAACPNSNTLITAGSSTVVCVWDVSISKDKLKHMNLKQALYGHTDTVTCVVASEAHSVIISGSQDQTCILWDLEELSYITQLPTHSSSVSALAINDLTGEIVSCSGTHLYLWTMKGQLLASVNTPYVAEGSIQCCCFTQKCEWDSRNVIIAGYADGIVRMWKTEYTKVQLPGHKERVESLGHAVSASAEDTERSRARWERHLVLCRELNRSQAISRRRYKNNPAVTALAISRTHGTLLVGDAWGRVFSWTCEG